MSSTSTTSRRGFSPAVLLLFSGTLWSYAGARVLGVGASHTSEALLDRWWFYVGALTVFVLFLSLVFLPLYGKYTRRIIQRGVRRCPFAFLTFRGWITVGVMIGMGVLVSRCNAVAQELIAIFYLGLGSALLLSGLLFLREALRRFRL